MMRNKRRKYHIRRTLFLSISVLIFVFGVAKGMPLFFKFMRGYMEPTLTTNINNQNIIDEMDNTINDQIYQDDEVYQQIKAMLHEDHKLQTILNNYEDYPKPLLEMLTRNMEMLNFVLNYQSKQGNVYADTIGNIDKGNIPLLLQWDERWGYGTYADSILAVNGCAPTALSMVISGLTGDETITPYVIATYAETNGYYIEGVGSSWDLIIAASQYYGVTTEELSLSQNNVLDCLQKGIPIICSMLPGDFTTTGHFIILVGLEQGKIIVNDPNSIERSNKRWDYRELEKQINNLWSMHL